MSKIKLVLFDVGNVIVRATHKITEAILWELGVRPDKAALFFHNPAYGQFARGKITGDQFAQAVREALEAPYLTDAQIRVAHDAHIYMADPAVTEILLEFSDRRVPIGFVTTTNVWQSERAEYLYKLEPRGHVVRSHVIGRTKIDPGAWPTIFEDFRGYVNDWEYLFDEGKARCNVPAVYANAWAYRSLLKRPRAESVLLVDDAAVNCEAARRAGLQTHQYDPTPVVGVRKLREALRQHKVLR